MPTRLSLLSLFDLPIFGIGVANRRVAGIHGLKHISLGRYEFLEPHDAVAMEIDGYPIIIAVAGKHMLVAHAGQDYVNAIDTITEALLNRGVPFKEIMMSVQMTKPAFESVYVEQALRTGLRYVWPANSFVDDSTYGSFFVIKRDE